jgi:ubiquinone/menaquinone biosynthesis C-methylase UbiE
MSTAPEQYLQAWHTRYPDACTIFNEARDEDGLSSVDQLLRIAPPGARVLDVACGAGYLLRALIESKRAHVAGVDLTFPELAIARERAPAALLSQARAQQLPFRDGSFDGVLCHMALMLLDDVDGVLDEITRVLRPGGLFAAVTNSAAEASQVAQAFGSALKGKRQMADHSLLAPALGDPRAQQPEGLKELVGGRFANVSVKPFEITQAVPRESLWRYLKQAAYGLDAFPDSIGAEVIEALHLPDSVEWPFAMLLVQGTRPELLEPMKDHFIRQRSA